MLCALPYTPPKTDIPPISIDPLHGEPTNIKSASDPELMGYLAAGLCDALAQLYQRHSGLLLALALKILHNRSDAEEIVQEVFLYVWRRAGDYDEARSSVPSWLVLIARSRSLDRLRSSNRAESMRSEVQRQEALVKSLPSEGFRQVLSGERALRMRRALDRLPPSQKQVLEFSYFQGWTQKEVAEKTGVPIGTVKTRTFLALKKLRRELSSELRQLM